MPTDHGAANRSTGAAEPYYGDRARFPLHASCWDRDHATLASLLLTSTTHEAIDRWDCSANTALDWAAGNGSAECVRLLLEHGASVQAVASDGWTALHYAAQWGDWPEVVALLLCGGAALHAVTSQRETALDLALAKGHSHTIGMLARAEGTTPAEEDAVSSHMWALCALPRLAGTCSLRACSEIRGVSDRPRSKGGLTKR
eukprot:COSAG06_NODE_246_length_19169_cov_28.627950_15_plen_201_part_00